MRCDAADHTAIDNQVVAVDEARFVGGQEHGSVGDVVDAAGTRDRLHLGHEGLHGLGEGVGLVGREAQRLGKDAGGVTASSTIELTLMRT